MKKTALILIDIQNDYFPGGRYPLFKPVEAAENAGKLLKFFRDSRGAVIHVQHEMAGENPPFFEPNTEGQKIHNLVEPVNSDHIIIKENPNSFQGTKLLQLLRILEIERVVIAGMMTHMCVASTIRESFEHGFESIVISDATTTRDLELDGRVIKAIDVHEANLASLGAVFATVSDTDTLISSLKRE